VFTRLNVITGLPFAAIAAIWNISGKGTFLYALIFYLPVEMLTQDRQKKKPGVNRAFVY
jgi:hypothetical protein